MSLYGKRAEDKDALLDQTGSSDSLSLDSSMTSAPPAPPLAPVTSLHLPLSLPLLAKATGQKDGKSSALKKKWGSRRSQASVDLEDLACHQDLTEDNIVEFLKERFKNGLTCVFVSETLWVINPYRLIPAEEEEPHVRTMASKCYSQMLQTGMDQHALISGESGSGKSELAKRFIRHLTDITAPKARTLQDLAQMIAKADPILEAFGNAETQLNRNSSRFAKVVEMKFTGDGSLRGAHIVDYLLEKTRVVEQQKGERNFHIFYCMFAGMSSEQLMFYHLSDPSKHRTVRNAGSENEEHLAKLFNEVEAAFQDFGFEKEEVQQVWRCLAAILFITDVTFTPDLKVTHSDRLAPVEDFPVQATSELLLVDKEHLAQAFVMSVRETHNEEVFVMHTEPKAIEARNSLARALYSRLFGWIIRRINQCLRHGYREKSAMSKTIGILDFSGFEVAHSNGFEQLCINMTNEKLQHFFLRCVCIEEQERYKQEEIEWQPIDFPHCEDRFMMFFDKPIGLLEILNTASREPYFTDKEFIEKLAVGLGTCPSYGQYFSLDRMSQTSFTINHYAAQVTYDARGFLVSNRNMLSTDLQQVMLASSDPFIEDLFSAELTETGCLSRTKSFIRSNSKNLKLALRPKGPGTIKLEKKQQPSIASYFRISLQEMLKKLKRGDLYFVRCIKPNALQRPEMFDDVTVLCQLHYNGILQIAEMRSLGFPHYMSYENFVSEYRVIQIQIKLSSKGNINLCRDILNVVAASAEVKFGKTKVFMKEAVTKGLMEKKRHSAAIILQRNMQRFLMILRLKNKRQSERHPSVDHSGSLIQSPPRTPELSMTSPVSSSSPADSRFKPAKMVTFKLPDLHETVQSEGSSTQEGNQEDTFYGSAQEEPEQDKESEQKLENGQCKPGEHHEQQEGSRHFEQSEDSDDSGDSEGYKLPVHRKKQPWDIAEDVDIEPWSAEESFRDVMKFLRLMVYIVTFLMVLATATASQLSLLGLTAAVGINSYASNITIDGKSIELDPIARDARWKVAVLQLIAIICAPKVLSVIILSLKSFFGHVPRPTAKLFLFAIVMETLQTFGETLLIIRVLPQFGSVMSLCLLFSVGLLPSFFKLMFWFTPRQRNATKKIKPTKLYSDEHVSGHAGLQSTIVTLLDMLFTLLAFTVQVAGLAFPVILAFYHLNQFWITGKEERVYHFATNKSALWEMPVALALTSIKWWENFVHRDRGCVPLITIKRQLFASRQKISPYISLWGIIVCITTFYTMELTAGNNAHFEGDVRVFLVGNQTYVAQREMELANENQTYMNSHSDQTVMSVVPCIVQIISGFLCFYFCSLACKLVMQRFSFTCALYLSVPTSIAIIVLQCENTISLLQTEGNMAASFTWLCDYHCQSSGCQSAYPAWAKVLTASLWIISLLYITSYVWNNQSEKMAMNVRLFVVPFYSGPLLVPSMLLNRRSLDREIKVAVNGIDLEFRDFDTSSFMSFEYVESGKHKKTEKANEKPVPLIYACATLWHETYVEMKQLLKSFFRMDMDQCARKIARTRFGMGESDYYELETHCLFDDAWEEDPTKKGVSIPNNYVKSFLMVINNAASSVYETEVELPPPKKIPTPYGAQLVWDLPGGNRMIVHLKDKSKIRHKKRWSQVMYMYYLLGWKLLGNDTSKIVSESLDQHGSARRRRNQMDERSPTKLIERFKDNKGIHMAEGFYTTGSTFEEIEMKVLHKAENTFILALDGDVDFRPEAVIMLIDRLKRNPKTGGVCGRIHPIGSGPVVWYQIFEYAIGHWLQKATEHVLGCVLCSPGCFSLFRGSTLMDTNIMCRYTTKSTEASHILQYDQGEDRWLCTLVLQQGYRIDYCAGADSKTYAPSSFNEFFNQRRRWMTSTLANIFDLLASYRTTVYINDNISSFYMFYQVLLTIATVLGPATVIIAIASAIRDILLISAAWALVISLLPAVVYLVITLVCREKIQLIAAAFVSMLYAVAMVVVLVGILEVIAMDGILAPSAAFFWGITLVFLLGGILHPYEFSCLAPAVIYFLCIPAGYLILTIYSFSNLHVVSWGTREAPKPVAQPVVTESKEAKKTFFATSFFQLDKYYNDFKQTVTKIMKDSDNCLQKQQLDLLREVNENIKKLNGSARDAKPEKDPVPHETVMQPCVDLPPQPETCEVAEKPKESDPEELFVEDPLRPEWAVHVLSEGQICYLPDDEVQFWKDFIRKYVKPLKNMKREEELKEKLWSLRNNISMGIWFLNAMWILLNYMIETAIPPLNVGPFKTPPLGFVFLSLCFLLLITQVIGMVIHRWGTFLQLIANTQLPWGTKSHKTFEREAVDEAVRITKIIQQQRSYPDPVTDKNPQCWNRRSSGGERIRAFLNNLPAQSVKLSLSHAGQSQKLQPAFNTISRGVAAAIDKQLRTSTLQPDSMSASCRYTRPDELERRFERRLSSFLNEEESQLLQDESQLLQDEYNTLSTSDVYY